MKQLTVNQIMILLDVCRGTETQKDIGTAIADVVYLQRVHLIEPTIPDAWSLCNQRLTEKGELIVDQMKSATGVMFVQYEEKKRRQCNYCSSIKDHCTDVEAEECDNYKEAQKAFLHSQEQTQQLVRMCMFCKVQTGPDIHQGCIHSESEECAWYTGGTKQETP